MQFRNFAFIAVLMLGFTFTAVAQTEQDPYLWLEGVDDEKALEWVKAENAATYERLKTQDLFDDLYAEAKSVLNASSRLPQVTQRGDWLYNFWRDKTNPRGIYRRTSLESFSTANPEWETVLDIDALSEAEGEQWVFKGMTCLPKHPQNCLMRLSPGGGDAVVTREFNSETLSWVEDGIYLPLAKGGASWIDAETLFVSTDFGEGTMTDSGYPRIVKRWKRGTPLESAETLFEGAKEDVSVSAFRMRSEGGDIDMLRVGKTFWASDRYQLLDDGMHQLQMPQSATINGVFQGRIILSLKQDWKRGETTYPQGAVLIADPGALHEDGKGKLEVLIEPNETTVVQSVVTTDSSILVEVLENVRGKIYRYLPGPEGQWESDLINFPDNGSLSITSTDDESGDFFASFESFTSPPALYFTSVSDWQPQKVKSQTPSFDGSKYKTEQFFATSADGTKVPYFVVLGNDAKLDGNNPTNIFSYGGFRNALTPSYSGSYENLSGAYGKMWLDRGGVFVLANIRGGGEFGPQWHQAALKENRHKAFEDFEAIAEDLFKRGITSPKHLGIEGRSNGGLLVGATMTRRPDLYGAVICGVPLLDMQRYHQLLAGASWMGEYGDPDIPEEWAYIREYSPYHNLSEGVDYPAVFFYTSTRDDRVHPGHARKMAAKMKAMDQEIWYYENLEGGHGGSSTNDQLAYRIALAYTHLWTQLK